METFCIEVRFVYNNGCVLVDFAAHVRNRSARRHPRIDDTAGALLISLAS